MANSVPNVLAFPVEQARQLLEMRGLKVSVVYTSAPKNGTMASESRHLQGQRRVVRQRHQESTVELVVGGVAGYVNDVVQTGDSSQS